MISAIISGILLILLGILAVPSLLLSKKPDAQAQLDKIAPYQGWIGVIFCILGILGIIFSLIGIGMLGWGLWYMISWIFGLLCAIVQTVLGFLLGYSLIAQKALSKNESAKEKGEELLAKLLPLQGKFGVAAIILGLVQIVLAVLTFVVFAAAVAVSV